MLNDFQLPLQSPNSRPSHKVTPGFVEYLRESTIASQIAEFAIGLPFLMVLLVGIFDFGQAFNTKQNINTIAREAARFASNQTTLDWSTGASAPSILATRDVIDSYLVGAHLNDCGLKAARAQWDGQTTWTFTASSGCQGNGRHPVKVVIQRANTFQLSDGTYVIGTKVTIAYPLQWHFNSVMKVLLPASNYPGPIFTISSDATMGNLS